MHWFCEFVRREALQLPRVPLQSRGRASPCPSLRSAGKLAIRRTLQARSNPVPGGYDN
ncbi:MAG: hypothetical protein LBM98_06065 [Oscillospiraceae bacterium]|nr:hypothetical protein [Oscillospiraceae bacterium]